LSYITQYNSNITFWSIIYSRISITRCPLTSNPTYSIPSEIYWSNRSCEMA